MAGWPLFLIWESLDTWATGLGSYTSHAPQWRHLLERQRWFRLSPTKFTLSTSTWTMDWGPGLLSSQVCEYLESHLAEATSFEAVESHTADPRVRRSRHELPRGSNIVAIGTVLAREYHGTEGPGDNIAVAHNPRGPLRLKADIVAWREAHLAVPVSEYPGGQVLDLKPLNAVPSGW